jgi:hypothetical protein
MSRSQKTVVSLGCFIFSLIIAGAMIVAAYFMQKSS